MTAIYYLLELINQKELDFAIIQSQISESWFMILFVLMLMPINWLVETIKWRSLVCTIQKISFAKSLNSILAGILLSLFTPNRIGELGGRLIFIEKANRPRVLYMNSVCSISQLLITMNVGIWSLIYFKEFLSAWILIEDSLLLTLVSFTSILLLAIYFYSNQLGRVFDFFSKKEESLENRTLEKKSRLRILSISLIRYIVFCIQFYFVAQIFEPSISVQISTASISLIFFLTAVVPTGWISDLPVRTSIAFFVFETIGLNGIAGLSASILLWLINLLLPALVSLILLRKVDWMGKLNWKNS